MMQVISQASPVFQNYRPSQLFPGAALDEQDRYEPSQFSPDLALSWRGRLPMAAQASTAQETSPRQQRLEVGLEAGRWGTRERRHNPNNDSYDWSNYSLGWARRGLEQATDREICWMHAPDSETAYKQARKTGKMHRGNPPAGALLFVPQEDGQYKVGFANPDGKTFRTTVPGNENPSTIGDRPLAKGKKVAWMLPPAGKEEAMPSGETKTKRKKDGSSSEVGLGARNWGVRKGKVNPNLRHPKNRREATSWGGYCLGWVRRAVEHSAGRDIPSLQATSARQAYAGLRKKGKVHYGNPPAGAIVFWDATNSKLGAKYGHVAIVNPNGKGYRGTSSQDFAETHHVGDRRFSARERRHIGWVMPEDLY